MIFAVAITLAVSAFAYTNIQNGSGTILNLIRFRKSHIKQIDKAITEKSDDFIQAAFRRDSKSIEQMLDDSAKYIQSKDGSGFIRFVGTDIHVEGYMATNKRLIKAKQRWYVTEDDQTITCSMEVYIEDTQSPQLWYLHFKKVKDDWKLFMLENGI